MNPVTRSLLQQLDDNDLKRWVEAWDEVEAVIIGIYKAAATGSAHIRRYRRLRGRLLKSLRRWSEALEPHWRASQMSGEPVGSDPFAQILGRAEAGDFVGDWEALQTLPAAREAINSFLLERLEAKAD
jgi:hypothetical protein